MMISFKSKSTGLVGRYPAKHGALSDDLVPVDDDGNVCLPCMGITETEEDKAVVESDSKPTNTSKDKK